jgi:hypothetical protein
MAEKEVDLSLLLRGLGLKENDMKGKSDREIIKFAYETLAIKKEIIENEAEKSIIDKAIKEVEKLKEFFKEPIEIYVKKVGQNKKPSIVKVIGYDTATSQVIVDHAGKCVKIPNDDFIKTTDELIKARDTKKPKAAKKKK